MLFRYNVGNDRNEIFFSIGSVRCHTVSNEILVVIISNL